MFKANLEDGHSVTINVRLRGRDLNTYLDKVNSLTRESFSSRNAEDGFNFKVAKL